MRTVIGLILALALASTAQAAALDASTTQMAQFVTAQTATGVSTNTLHIGRMKFRTLIVTMWNTAGTATAQLEINCVGATTATGWALVANSVTNLTVSTAALDTVYPACDYRLNVTACSTCSVNAHYYVGPDIQ